MLSDSDELNQFHGGKNNKAHHALTKFESNGKGKGIGAITIRKHPHRQPPHSSLTSKTHGKPFPAVHDMVLNVHVTMPDLLPGITLQNIIPPNPGPAILRNPNVTNFPPQNDVYQLVEPIELEDVNNPGPVLATIQSFPLTVNPPTP
jgi:hypothetical protein